MVDVLNIKMPQGQPDMVVRMTSAGRRVAMIDKHLKMYLDQTELALLHTETILLKVCQPSGFITNEDRDLCRERVNAGIKAIRELSFYFTRTPEESETAGSDPIPTS